MIDDRTEKVKDIIVEDDLPLIEEDPRLLMILAYSSVVSLENKEGIKRVIGLCASSEEELDNLRSALDDKSCRLIVDRRIAEDLYAKATTFYNQQNGISEKPSDADISKLVLKLILRIEELESRVASLEKDYIIGQEMSPSSNNGLKYQEIYQRLTKNGCKASFYDSKKHNRPKGAKDIPFVLCKSEDIDGKPIVVDGDKILIAKDLVKTVYQRNILALEAYKRNNPDNGYREHEKYLKSVVIAKSHQEASSKIKKTLAEFEQYLPPYKR